MAKPEGNRGLPPLDWLRVFEAAGRLGSFTGAAEEFGSTQAAVSQRIRNLESWLGRKLFVRAARGVSLTVEGESYLPLVQNALTALQQGTEDLFATAQRELRIAGLDSHLTGLLLPRLRHFRRAYPDVRLVTDLVPKRSDFDAEKTALQIRFGAGRWPGREARLLQPEELQPMTAANSAANWQDLPLIEVRGERPGWREWADRSGAGPLPGASYSFDSMGHGLQAARLGLGVVLGSRVLAGDLLASGALRLCGGHSLLPDQGYWLTWPEDYTASSRRRGMAEALVEALRDQP